MKEIIALIRPKKLAETKRALADAGLPAYTGRSVNGRGYESVDIAMPGREVMKTGFMPKRKLIIAVHDEDVDKAVCTIMAVNRTGNHGDGKIFVVPVMAAYRVSTGKYYSGS